MEGCAAQWPSQWTAEVRQRTFINVGRGYRPRVHGTFDVDDAEPRLVEIPTRQRQSQ